ncbi:MAG: NUDIX domain-containing protein [Chromatiales bacterium]|nr:NUDIX domain-containing protein [Chromatiales bacterium]
MTGSLRWEETDPLDAARRELYEETGLGEEVDSSRLRDDQPLSDSAALAASLRAGRRGELSSTCSGSCCRSVDPSC